MNNQQNQSTQSTQTNNPLDFFLNPINIGDYVGEAYQGGIRIGKVLKITEKTIFLSCRREQSRWHKTPYLASSGMENISKAIAEIKEHNGKRPVARYTWGGEASHIDAQTNLINFTSLNLLSDEIIENRV